MVKFLSPRNKNFTPKYVKTRELPDVALVNIGHQQKIGI